MKKIRIGLFETNSSSTHSIIICTDEELDKWKKGEILRGYYEGFVPYSEDLDKDEYFTYDEYIKYREEEVYENKYITKNGEVLHIICKYGYDG